jgi:hypothetical protein
MPVVMKPGAPLLRKSSNVSGVWAFVADLDSGAAVYHSADTIAGAGLRAVIHSTWSHSREHPKARAVFPFDEVCPVERWPDVWRSAVVWAETLGLEVDPACKDASRLYFLPSLPSEDWARAHSMFYGEAMEGDLLPWSWLLDAYPAPVKAWAPPPLANAGRCTDALRGDEGRRQKFARRLVEHRAQQLIAQGEGGRNRRLFGAGWAAAQLAVSGALDLEWAAAELMAAAEAAGLDFKEADKALRNGIARGNAAGPWHWET